MKTKSIIMGLLFTTLIIISACTPNPPKPIGASGTNIIRYKVNGQQVEINGKWNALSSKGVSIDENNFYILIGGQTGNSNSKISLGFTKPIILLSDFYSDSLNGISCTFPKDTKQLNTNNKLNSIVFTVSSNTSTFISGKFMGKTFSDGFNSFPIDSLLITEGYFDIAK